VLVAAIGVGVGDWIAAVPELPQAVKIKISSKNVIYFMVISLWIKVQIVANSGSNQFTDWRSGLF